MVNVNAPLPFNLSNNNHSHRQPRLSHIRTRSPQPSLDTERQSVVSSASASHDLDDDMRWPTLNVRIVRGGSALARGRPITRDVVTHSHEPGTEGEESGVVPTPAPTVAAGVAEEQPAEEQSDAVRIDSSFVDLGSLPFGPQLL
jgi:hypothetical protein